MVLRGATRNSESSETFSEPSSSSASFSAWPDRRRRQKQAETCYSRVLAKLEQSERRITILENAILNKEAANAMPFYPAAPPGLWHMNLEDHVASEESLAPEGLQPALHAEVAFCATEDVASPAVGMCTPSDATTFEHLPRVQIAETVCVSTYKAHLQVYDSLWPHHELVRIGSHANNVDTEEIMNIMENMATSIFYDELPSEIEGMTAADLELLDIMRIPIEEQTVHQHKELSEAISSGVMRVWLDKCVPLLEGVYGVMDLDKHFDKLLVDEDFSSRRMKLFSSSQGRQPGKGRR